MSRRAVSLAAITLALLPAGAAASPYIHAHRGGSLVRADGKQRARYPENSQAAFRAAAAAGYVLELDAKLTADGVPVVLHDATLERTTNCEGAVAAQTAVELREDCELDLLGTAEVSRQLRPADARRAPVPTLAEVLRLAGRRGASINLEVKNIPTDPDFELGDAFAESVAKTVRASGFPPSRLIVQSFWPLNLDVFEADPYFADAETSLLTLRDPPTPLNQVGPAFARARGYEWVSPQWPIDELGGLTTAAYIAEAHALGLRVVPFTLDDAESVREATLAGVDAVITNDPAMGRRVIARAGPARPRIPPPPSQAECLGARAGLHGPPVVARSPAPGAPRVFAMQFMQELRHVRSYSSFRTKIECTIREYVVPRMARGRPNLVAFNEDVGLMTIATGSRGSSARALFEEPASGPSCEPQGVPCGVLLSLAAVTASYGGPLAAYLGRFAPDLQPLSAAFVSATDTFARGWMQVFSDMARRYGIYILGSNNQAPFRESVDPSEIAAFADPDRPRPESVFVATSPRVYNEVFMWGPEDVNHEGPTPLRNVVTTNRKVPLTPIEETIQLAPGASTGPDAIENLRPYRLPETRARIGFATSLPAFIYGHELGAPQPLDPCSDTASFYMQCMDRLGVNLVIQDEANPGRWAGPAGEGTYQPLEWMRSTWRAVADPSAGFTYNVTPHMVGNLADLAFDGQTAITQRGLRGRRRCTYVGNSSFQPAAPENDPLRLRPYAGRKREFLAIAPWVVPDAPRARLRATSIALAPGSGAPTENDYLETAVVADLPFPALARRANCVGVRGGG